MDDAESTDRVAILAAATDYAEAWLDGDAERMARCLHPALAKRTVEDPPSGDLALHEAPYERMIPATERRSREPVLREYGLVVLDVFDGIATAKILSAWYMDYLHLARFGERWLIVNVLYAVR
jgi:Putative lumazine-binding